MPHIKYTLRRVYGNGVWGWELRGQTIMDEAYRKCRKWMITPVDPGLVLSVAGRAQFADPDAVNNVMSLMFEDMLPKFLDKPNTACVHRCRQVADEGDAVEDNISVSGLLRLAMIGPGRDGNGTDTCVDGNGDPISVESSQLSLWILETLPNGVDLLPILDYIDIWSAHEDTPSQAIDDLDATISAFYGEDDLRVIPGSASATYTNSSGSLAISVSGGTATITLTSNTSPPSVLIGTVPATGTWSSGGTITLSGSTTARIEYMSNTYVSNSMLFNPGGLQLKNQTNNALNVILPVEEDGTIDVSGDPEFAAGARIPMFVASYNELIDPASERCRYDFTYGNRRPMLVNCGYVDFQLKADEGIIKPAALPYPKCRIDVRPRT